MLSEGMQRLPVLICRICEPTKTIRARLFIIERQNGGKSMREHTAVTGT